MCSESGLPDDLSWGRLGYNRWLDTAQDLCHSKITHPLDHTDFTLVSRPTGSSRVCGPWGEEGRRVLRHGVSLVRARTEVHARVRKSPHVCPLLAPPTLSC